MTSAENSGAHTRPTAHFREAGRGPTVVCIHSNASTSAQWRPLMDKLAPSYRVLAPDLYGVGSSPKWQGGNAMTLRDEVDLLAPVLDAPRDGVHLVGHSYGAAVALVAALAQPDRIRSIAVYEPVLFSLLEQHTAGHPAAAGIRSVTEDALAWIQRGDTSRAARRFVDYWMQDGTWALMPPPRRAAIEATITNMENWSHALSLETATLEAFAALDVPVLYIVGTSSPASSRAVAKLLTRTLPNVTTLELPGIGHMGPITHPEEVNGYIADFLGKCQTR